MEAPAVNDHEGCVVCATLRHPGVDERLEERAVVGGHVWVWCDIEMLGPHSSRCQPFIANFGTGLIISF